MAEEKGQVQTSFFDEQKKETVKIEERPLAEGKQEFLIEEEPDTGIKAESHKEYVVKGLRRAKSYYETTVFITGALFLLNFLLLYFGTIYGEEKIHVAKFYGFREGQHDNLQRTNGIFCFVMFMINMLPLLKDEAHGKGSLLVFSALCNVIVIGHYIIETFYFRSMRMEVMSIQAFILAINLYWSVVDYNQRRKVKVLMGREAEEADMDTSLRKKLREMGMSPKDKLRKMQPGEA